MKQVFGIIGAGMIGETHTKSIRTDGRGQVRWLADRSESLLSAKQEKLGVPCVTTNFQEVLSDPEVTAVVIATPPGTHLEIALAALRAGKNVLLEKPAVARREDLQGLLTEAGRGSGPVLMECSARHARLNAKFHKVKALIASGELGEVHHMRQFAATPSTFVEWNPQATWALDRSVAGSPCLDWGVYDLSFHLGVFDDKPELVSLAARTWSGPKGARHDSVLMGFRNGLTYSYERGTGIPHTGGNSTQLVGTKGQLSFDYYTWGSPIVVLTRKNGTEITTEEFTVDASQDDHLVLTSHFLDCLEGKATPAIALETAAKHLDILFQFPD